MNTFKKMLVASIVFTSCAATQSVMACTSGYTCFSDGSATSKVFYSNRNWGDFSWSNRATYFFNNGNSQHNCLYDKVLSGTSSLPTSSAAGLNYRLRKGNYLYTTSNFNAAPAYGNTSYHKKISANIWTSGSTCVR